MELVISLSLAGILTVVLISGNVFIQKILSGWTSDSRLAEEGEWILGVVADRVKTCDSLGYNASRRTWNFYFGRDTLAYTFIDDRLRSKGKELQGKDFAMTKFDLYKIPFPDKPEDSILKRNWEFRTSGLYRIELTLRYRGKLSEFHTTVRNWNEFVNQAD